MAYSSYNESDLADELVYFLVKGGVDDAPARALVKRYADRVSELAVTGGKRRTTEHIAEVGAGNVAVVKAWMNALDAGRPLSIPAAPGRNRVSFYPVTGGGIHVKLIEGATE